MKPIMRRYQRPEDYWRIRQFLRDLLITNRLHQVAWDLARFDYWRWHGILNMKDGTLETDVFLWEDRAGELVAVLNREAPGSVFLQIHPDHVTNDLVVEMIETAEKHLTVPTADGHRRHHVWVESEDVQFKDMLAGHGYKLAVGKYAEKQRRRDLSAPVATVAPAEGYRIRPLGDIDEHSARCWLSWKAFHPDEPDADFVDGWYVNIQRAPLYRRDLDLVAVAPDGELAAFCTIWYDDVTRTGLFEPVGTHPDHRQRGLGKAILTEGLIRLHRLGAALAYVGSYTDPAHALYASVGFETYRTLEPWEKIM